MFVVVVTSICSFVMALFLVPLLAKLANRIGLVDRPDDKRKLHETAVPMVGGLALFFTVAVIAPVAIYLGYAHQPLFVSFGEYLFAWIPVNFGRRLIRIQPDDVKELIGLLAGSLVLVGVGVWDDWKGLRGRQKLFGQIVATTVLILFGYHFNEIAMAGYHFKFEIFSIFFVYAWVIAAINSVNLLDGADGIAGTIGIIMSLALTSMAIYQGEILNAIITISIAGALCGFLRYNFPPAKVYLGDTGSMLIGFLLAAMAIRCTFKQSSAFAFFAPVAFLAIPFIDTAAAIIRRRLTGRSIFAVDRGHLHHSLMKRGYSPRTSLLWVALLSAMTAVGGILSVVNQQSEYAIVSIGLVVIVMLSCRIFGLAEYQLVSKKASSVAKSLLKMNGDGVQQSSVHVQGSRDWQQTWDVLCQFAEEVKLIGITLDVNAPWLHESFHATRKHGEKVGNDGHGWTADVPLITKGRRFGKIEIVGDGKLDHHRILNGILEIGRSIEASMSENAESSAA